MCRLMRTAAASLVLAALALTPSTVSAEVVDRSAAGFTVRTTVPVMAPAARVYQTLLDVGAWWDREHTYSGDARNLSLAAQPGGCFCEKLPGGGAVEHGRVVNVSRDSLLRLSGALGPLQELAVAGTLTWQIEPQGAGSRITLTYTAGGYAAGGLDKLADVVDAVTGRQVQLLKAYVEKSR